MAVQPIRIHHLPADEATPIMSEHTTDTVDDPAPDAEAAIGLPNRVVFLAAALLMGAVLGLGSFTFHYAKGTSYLSSASEACANCHIMQDHYDAWVKSSHAKFAQCNDCHSPHDFIGKYYCKSRNGYFHSKAFTLQNFHEPIMIHDYNRGVVEDNCRYCHQDLVHSIDTYLHDDENEPLSCIRCHADVGHPN